MNEPYPTTRNRLGSLRGIQVMHAHPNAPQTARPATDKCISLPKFRVLVMHSSGGSSQGSILAE